MLFGGGWFEAKEMWSRGCQSFVAILRVKGRERRVFIVGAMALPSDTAREPFWWVVSVVEGCTPLKLKGHFTNRWTKVLLEVHYY